LYKKTYNTITKGVSNHQILGISLSTSLVVAKTIYTLYGITLFMGVKDSYGIFSVAQVLHGYVRQRAPSNCYVTLLEHSFM